MASLFPIKQVLPDDATGFGAWLTEHYYQHLQFVQLGLKQTPVRFIPDYDIISWSDEPGIQKLWLWAHQTIHNCLRSWPGIQGIDLATVDLSDNASWFDWLDAHAQEHGEIESALGLA